jgi:hypothetical protein
MSSTMTASTTLNAVGSVIANAWNRLNLVTRQPAGSWK